MLEDATCSSLPHSWPLPAAVRTEPQEPTDAAPRRAAMWAVNPLYIPRNRRVEAVIRAAIDEDDFAPFHELVTVLSNPFEVQPAFARYAEPPAEHEQVHRTFCGT